MLRNITLIILLLAVLGFSTYAQVDKENQEEDEAKEKIWNLLKGGKITAEEANRMLYGEMQKSLNKKNVPIEFYGKVIDQEGNPVEEAEVNGTLGYYTLDPENYMDFIPVKTKTDKEGRFSFKPKEKGINLTIGSPKKDGYEDSYHAGHKTAKFTKDGYIFEHKTEIPKRPDPNNPEIFQIRKKGEPTILITGESFYVAFSKIESESYAVTFVPDPFNGGIRRRSVEEAKRIGLRTDVVITLKKVGDDYATINIKPIGEDAGIIFSKERLYILPEKGYEKEIDIEMKKGQTYYFSVKSGVPNVYSLFCIESLIINEEKAIIECWSITNPYGERNLESGVIENGREYVEDARRNLLRGKYPIKPQIKVKSCSQSK